ncbi:MAG: DNA-processing protein DprA [Patescibacteria group bacterium]
MSKTNCNQTKYLVALSYLDGIGPRTINQLLEYYNGAAQTWQAPAEELEKILTPKLFINFVTQRGKLNPDHCYDLLAKHQLTAVTIDSTDYPERLKQISDPPLIMYVRGNPKALNNSLLSVVGTRRCTSYGEEAVKKIVKPLADFGLTIVSGLALGIDSLAHRACLPNGRTIAVLAGGLDYIYPAVNNSLARAIISAGGCLISEQPPGIRPNRGRFPQRNRIIAGLSKATLVIEAGERSGALITAYQALEENREVWAVPGSIFSPVSKGTNKLIAAGARPVTQAADIIHELGRHQPEQLRIIPEQLSPLAQKVITVIDDKPRHIDNIIEKCKLDSSIVGAELAYLELNGLVKNIGGQRYLRYY